MLWHHGGVPAARVVVVLSPHQNAFFAEIAEVVVAELTDMGREAMVVTEPGLHLVRPHDVFVLLPPHEYVALEGSAFVDAPSVAARTIAMSAEQPHQHFFARNAELGARLGAVVDFSPRAVEAYRRAGVDARHLPFGYTSRWDRRRPGHPPEGPPRVLYLGNKRPRRLRVLAGAAESLARHRARLLISDNDVPNRASGPAFVAGEDKRELLAATRLLVNVHQSDEPYFEWLRFVEAAHCGTPVLSERSSDSAPFVGGTHFAEFDAADLGPALDALVDDDRRLAELADAAYDELRRHPFASALEVLGELADCVVARTPPPRALPARTRTDPMGDPEPITGARLRGAAAPTALASPRPRRWLRRPQLVVVGHDCHDVVGAFGSGPLEHVRPEQVERLVDRAGRASVVLLVPDGTRPIGDDLGELVARVREGNEAVAVAAVVAGTDGAGAATLEGIWPWQPWRLCRSQHLGRLFAVRGAVAAAAGELLADPAFAGQPHLAIQVWMALHGLAADHLGRPVARVHGVTLDPTHAVDEPASGRAREILTASAG